MFGVSFFSVLSFVCFSLIRTFLIKGQLSTVIMIWHSNWVRSRMEGLARRGSAISVPRMYADDTSLTLASTDIEHINYRLNHDLR